MKGTLSGLVMLAVLHLGQGQFFRSPTDIGGVPENGLILAKNNYTVHSMITVPQGNVLTIQAGTRLSFKERVGIMVHGQLVANGNSLEEIMMEPEEDTRGPAGPAGATGPTGARGATGPGGPPRPTRVPPGPQPDAPEPQRGFPPRPPFTPRPPRPLPTRPPLQWNGVTLSSKSVGEVMYPKSSLKHVRIHKSRSGLRIIDHRVDIDHVTVTESGSNGISYTRYSYDEVVVLKNVVVRDSRGYGIFFGASVARQPAMIQIDSSTVVNSRMNGLYVSRRTIPGRSVPSLAVTGCLFRENPQGAIEENTVNRTVISNCTFIQNGRVYRVGKATRVEFTNNRVVRNGGKYSSTMLAIMGTDYAKVEGNVFSNNHYVGNKGWGRSIVDISLSNPVVVMGNESVIRQQNIQISGNEFRGNINHTLIHLARSCYNTHNVMKSADDQVCHCTACFIRENVFQNNELSEHSPALSVIHLERLMQEVTITRNSFMDTGRPGCAIKSQQNPSLGEVDARRNYWATTDLNLIYARICGFNKIMDHSFVHVVPIYTTNARDEESAVSWDSAYINGNKLGGEIKGRLSLPRARDGSCTYTMSYNTYIRPEGTLVIPAGCLIKFDESIGIFVAGNLEFQGTSDRPVTLEYSLNAPGGTWRGIVYVIKHDDIHKEVKVEYVNVETARSAFRLVKAVRFNRPPPSLQSLQNPVDVTIDHVNIKDCLNGFEGAYQIPGTHRIRNSSFRNAAKGINFGASPRMTINIEGCHFENNSISIYSASMHNSSTVNINNCTFQNGAPNNIDCEVRINVLNSKLSISRNHFSQIPKHIMCLSIRTPNDKCEISNNMFTGNTKGAGLLVSFTSVRDVEIRGNTFLDNQNDRGTACIVMNPSAAPSDKSLDIYHNYFRGNHGRYIVQLVNHHWPTTEPHVKVHSNRFQDNYASLATINAAVVSCAINNNNFENPGTTTEVRIGLNRETRPRQINCENNYWGTTDINKIQGKIIDRSDFSDFNLAKFEPYLDEPNPDALFSK